MDGSRVPGPRSVIYDDGQQRRVDTMRAKLAPLVAKQARGEKLSQYELGVAQSVAVGRAPQDLQEAANGLLTGSRRGGTTGQQGSGQGLTEQQVRKAINDAMGTVRQQIQDLVRDLEGD